jgi:hypothetical protein
MLRNEQEYLNTKVKLQRLKARYQELKEDTEGDQRRRELSMLALGRLIKQMREEVAVFDIGRSSVAETPIDSTRTR